MISEEDKNRVRAATDLVALVQETVPLKPRGQDLWGCCPFHGEKTPSFHVIPATQVWHCFGCGEGGDCFSYIMKRENLSFPEAIRYLADRAGIEIEDSNVGARRGTKRSRIIDVCEETSNFYHLQLMRGPRRPPARLFLLALDGLRCVPQIPLGYAPGRGALVAHLSSKGFTAQEMIDANVAIRRDRGNLADRFYERVMFPIFDERGACIAFGGRIMGDGQPKYLNTAETAVFHKKKNLYAFNWAKEHIVAEAQAVVVEGYTDAIACHEAGIGNVVATLGTALTEYHVKTLSRFAKQIVYLFDGDAAGQKAAERAIQFIEQSTVDLRCVVLPDGMDPMEFITARGGDALRALLAGAEPLMDFVFRKLEERSDTATPGGRAAALDEACRLIYPLRSSYLVDSYYMQIADRLQIDVDTVRGAAQRVFRTVAGEEANARRREQMREAASRGAGKPGARSGLDRPASGSALASAPVDPAIGDVPYDYVPDDAYGYDVADVAANTGAVQSERADGAAYAASPASPMVLSDLERRALDCERELLTMLTSAPDSFRPFAERITEIDWVDPRHESIAWAVLATPRGRALPMPWPPCSPCAPRLPSLSRADSSPPRASIPRRRISSFSSTRSSSIPCNVAFERCRRGAARPFAWS